MIPYIVRFLRYVCRKLADSCKLIIVEDQKNELSIAKTKIKELESTIYKLKDDLRKYEKSSKKHKE